MKKVLSTTFMFLLLTSFSADGMGGKIKKFFWPKEEAMVTEEVFVPAAESYPHPELIKERARELELEKRAQEVELKKRAREAQLERQAWHLIDEMKELAHEDLTLEKFKEVWEKKGYKKSLESVLSGFFKIDKEKAVLWKSRFRLEIIIVRLENYNKRLVHCDSREAGDIGRLLEVHDKMSADKKKAVAKLQEKTLYPEPPAQGLDELVESADRGLELMLTNIASCSLLEKEKKK